ncbi:MAG: PAS domain-containing protein [Candidatus Riflebacteria bacterium]|nr:PAS domain-containing protein [Candidatus Riflebacteria bacterium]
MLNEEIRKNKTLELSGIASFEWDKKCGCFSLDSAFLQLLEIKSARKCMSLESFENLIYPDDRAKFLQQLDFLHNCASNINFRENFYEAEIRFMNESKKCVWLKLRGQFCTNGDDTEPQIFLCTATNITKLKEIEQEILCEYNLLTTGPTVVFKLRAEEGWPADYVSANIKKEFGYRPEEFTENRISVFDIIHPDDADRVRNDVSEYVKAEIPFFEQEYRIRSKNGEYRNIYDYTAVLRDSSMNITHFLGYVIDITHQKKIEEKLSRQSDEWLDAFCDFSKMGAGSISNIVKFFVDKVAKISDSEFVLTVEMIGEAPFISILNAGNFSFYPIPPEECQRIIDQVKPLKIVFETSEEYINNFRYEFKTDDPKLAPFFFNVSNLMAIPVLEDGKTHQVVLIGERKHPYNHNDSIKIPQLANAIRKLGWIMINYESWKKSQEMYHSAPVAFIYWDLSRRIIDWSKKAETVFGWTREEAVGKDLVELLVPEHVKENLKNIADSIRGGKLIEHEINENVTKSGKIIICEWNNSVLSDNSGNPSSFLSLAHDITEKIQMEKQLQEQMKEIKKINVNMEAANKELEAFSYSVSHDLRAPLRSLDGFSQALLEDYFDKLDEGAKDYLKRIRNASTRMGSLIEGLLQLSRITRSPISSVKTDLGIIAEETFSEIKNTIPGRAINFDAQKNVFAKCDENLIRALLQNLIGNAIKFTSKKDPAIIQFGTFQKDGKTVFFVKDNGAGFDMKYYGKLFGAFQRLHGVQDFEGTGIGLATVKRIINRHGGEIWGEARENEGATFYFTLD